MSLITEIMAKSTKDAHLFEPNAFGGDYEKIKKVEQNMSKPGFSMAAEPGYIESGAPIFLQVPKAPYPQLELTNLRDMQGLIDTISTQSTTMDGSNESSKETGILFERKREQGEIGMAYLYATVARFWREIGHAYIGVAQSLYSGIYATIPLSSGEFIELNRPELASDGREYLSNNVAYLGCHNVVVTQSPNGLTQRINDRITSIEMIRVLPETMGATKLTLAKQMLRTMDNYTASEREAMLQLASLEQKAIQSNLELQIMNAEAQKMQIEQMLAQSQQPPQPQEGQPQQGGQPPVEGEQLTEEQIAQQMAQQGEMPVPEETQEGVPQ
jgi:hypothetical protein